MKKREPLIFSKAFLREADKAVERAVQRSEAADLPRAYLHSYDELPEFLAQLRERNKSAE
ncbi:hypothetical protein HH212_27000 (plasmid) [Massilia forsythiae]|uniref:Uncharacterized protein n=1 Tax=Massilia forsythiae TaxID=2728020 RepID=A0A7Z2ZVI5_9BURK|nr:hypothetical protein [Massilia forsythiae]QJE03746.1 hypothetical protein HH212_27000 [Massilia forsythiae]